jgi:WhiB family redox-sensing transcriptional regulator
MTVLEPYGIWGGLGEIERRQLFLRQRREARKAMSAH